MVVGVLVFIDVATLTTWQIVDPFYRVTSQGKPEVSQISNYKFGKLNFFYIVCVTVKKWYVYVIFGCMWVGIDECFHHLEYS